jgi:VWFA-related protein
MRESRDRVIAAVTAFAEASHPDDEFAALVFSDHVRRVLPAARPFTSDPVVLRDALAGDLAVRGLTAFHDALARALLEVERGRHARKVLIVIGDGDDNASRLPFDTVHERMVASNVVIYTVALLDPYQSGQNPKALRRLAQATGGLAFEPGTGEMVEAALRTIAADIRNSYTLAYVPDSSPETRLRRLQVKASIPGGVELKVRTRAAYAAVPSSSSRALAREGE